MKRFSYFILDNENEQISGFDQSLEKDGFVSDVDGSKRGLRRIIPFSSTNYKQVKDGLMNEKSRFWTDPPDLMVLDIHLGDEDEEKDGGWYIWTIVNLSKLYSNISTILYSAHGDVLNDYRVFTEENVILKNLTDKDYSALNPFLVRKTGDSYDRVLNQINNALRRKRAFIMRKKLPFPSYIIEVIDEILSESQSINTLLNDKHNIAGFNFVDFFTPFSIRALVNREDTEKVKQNLNAIREELEVVKGQFGLRDHCKALLEVKGNRSEGALLSTGIHGYLDSGLHDLFLKEFDQPLKHFFEGVEKEGKAEYFADLKQDFEDLRTAGSVDAAKTFANKLRACYSLKCLSETWEDPSDPDKPKIDYKLDVMGDKTNTYIPPQALHEIVGILLNNTLNYSDIQNVKVVYAAVDNGGSILLYRDPGTWKVDRQAIPSLFDPKGSSSGMDLKRLAALVEQLDGTISLLVQLNNSKDRIWIDNMKEAVQSASTDRRIGSKESGDFKTKEGLKCVYDKTGTITMIKFFPKG